VKASDPSLITKITLIKPTMTALQRTQPTRSPNKGAASAVMKKVSAYEMVEAVANSIRTRDK